VHGLIRPNVAIALRQMIPILRPFGGSTFHAAWPRQRLDNCGRKKNNGLDQDATISTIARAVRMLFLATEPHAEAARPTINLR